MAFQSSQEESHNTIWTIREVLTWTTNRFKQADLETPLLDAQLLLCRVLNMQKINLYMEMDKPLSAPERALLRAYVKRRLNGEPTAYILNEKYWYNLKFYVDNRVLIPRPETECIVEFSQILMRQYKNSPNIIFDFCTGSGCLAITLAKEFPQSTVIGIDVSSQALEVAKINARENKVTNVQWLQRDLTHLESYEYLKEKYGKADIIVANPPYVTEEEWAGLDISVKNYEPKIALTAPEHGLFIGSVILSSIEKFNLLKNEFSLFCMEMAPDQPKKLLNNNLPQISYQFMQERFLLNQFFTLSDFDEKYRFLSKVSFSQ
jgi:release factor glutamine methyltransferase